MVKLVFEKAILVDHNINEYEGKSYESILIASEGSQFKLACDGLDVSSIPNSEPLKLEIVVEGKVFNQKQNLRLREFKFKPFYNGSTAAA
jgi:hypothetical protein